MPADLPAIVVNAGALGAAMLGIALLALSRGTGRHVRALMALLAIFAVDVASSIFDLSPLARTVPQGIWISQILWPWMPVCLWAYVDGLTARGDGSANYRWHYLAAAAGSLCLVPFLLLPGSHKLAISDGALESSTLHHVIAALGLLAFYLLWIGHMLVIGVLAIRRLAVHRKRMRELLSDVAAVDLRWIDGFMVFVAGGVALAIADNLLPLTAGGELLGTLGAAIFEAVLIAGLALFGLNQPRAVPEWAETSEVEEEAPQPEPRYARSSLTEHDCAAIIARLDALMASAEPWRNPFLNLKMLAERIATKPYYVTQALNTVLARNFYDYVNGWRVRAAARALAESDTSVLAISEESGFNSKSTFNSVFRKEMGMTPMAYRRTHRPQAAG